MGFVVQHLPLSREFVFRPHLLQVDQPALARTKQPVLESGERQELILGEHGGLGNFRFQISDFRERKRGTRHSGS